MEIQSDFVIESFKRRKREFRADKGKKHRYPKTRVSWNYSSRGQSKPNLNRYGTNAKYIIMNQENKFKNPAEIREYWRVHKQEQRLRKAK